MTRPSVPSESPTIIDQLAAIAAALERIAEAIEQHTEREHPHEPFAQS